MHRAIEITTDALLVDGVVSVGAWEKPIQAALAEAVVTPGDRVLEIGFGLGMASAVIQGLGPHEHWIIEPNIATVREKNVGSALVIHATWQVTLPLLRNNQFDAMVYEPDPPQLSDFDGSVVHTYKFISEVLPHATKILALHGRLGFIDFSGLVASHPDFIEEIDSLGLSCHRIEVAIHPPRYCRYAKKGIGNVIRLTKQKLTL